MESHVIPTQSHVPSTLNHRYHEAFEYQRLLVELVFFRLHEVQNMNGRGIGNPQLQELQMEQRYSTNVNAHDIQNNF